MIPRKPKDMFSDSQQPPLGVSRDVKDSQWKVLQTAARIANAKIRKEFLDEAAKDTYFADKLRQVRRKNIAYLRDSWSPLKADPDYGFCLTIRDSDVWLVNDPHYFRVEKIATDAIQEAMLTHADVFLSALLRDALKSPHPYYRISDNKTPYQGRLKTLLKGLFSR